MLPRLDHNINERLADYVNKTIEVQVVIAFIVNKTRNIVVLYNLSICCIHNMAAVEGKNTVILELICCFWERTGEFREKKPKCGQRNLRSEVLLLTP